MGINEILRSLVGKRPRRLQVAALCLRDDGAQREVLMVTSRGKRRWILPKGWPMAGLDLAGSAAQEAWEEAGVRGEVEPQSIGRYHCIKALAGKAARPLEIRVFRMRNITLADDFPEAGQRERRWWSLPDAAAVVHEPELAELLLQATGFP